MEALLDAAIARRQRQLDESRKTPHPKTAYRLFDGFREGDPRWVLDVFGSTLVVFDYKVGDPDGEAGVIAELARKRLPFVRTAVRKPKGAKDPVARRGEVILGRRLTCAARSRKTECATRSGCSRTTTPASTSTRVS